jgi:hypothetical protein
MRGNVHHIAMTGLCGTHCNLYLCLLHYDADIHIAATCVCSSHCDITIFGRLQCYYVRHIETLIYSSDCNVILWRAHGEDLEVIGVVIFLINYGNTDF